MNCPREPGKVHAGNALTTMNIVAENRIIASEWASHAAQLAIWAQTRLVNRGDVWGRFGADGASFTAPRVEDRCTQFLSKLDLHLHFNGTQIVGLHAIANDSTSKWFAFDIDAHNDQADCNANFAVAMRLLDAVNSAGLKAIVEDSNGRGGFHIWVVLDGPIPSELAYRLARLLRTEADAAGIEAFPKQQSVSSSRPFGNFLRVPGKHHKARPPHWSRIYDAVRGTWLEGSAAIEALLNSPVNATSGLDLIVPACDSPKRSRTDTRLPVVNPSVMPVCIADLLERSIRKPGDRNRGMLTLARYLKAADYSQSEAAAIGAEWMAQIPRSFTSSDLTAAFCSTNAASVVHWVYSGERGWSCDFVYDLSDEEGKNPLACNRGNCEFVGRQEVETRIPTVVRIEIEEPNFEGEIDRA